MVPTLICCKSPADPTSLVQSSWWLIAKAGRIVVLHYGLPCYCCPSFESVLACSLSLSLFFPFGFVLAPCSAVFGCVLSLALFDVVALFSWLGRDVLWKLSRSHGVGCAIFVIEGLVSPNDELALRNPTHHFGITLRLPRYHYT